MLARPILQAKMIYLHKPEIYKALIPNATMVRLMLDGNEMIVSILFELLQMPKPDSPAGQYECLILKPQPNIKHHSKTDHSNEVRKNKLK